MRVLVVSARYPPVSLGGYEAECYAVVERLRGNHEVLVLTSAPGARFGRRQHGVRRELPLLSGDALGALRAPVAAVRGARAVRRALAWRPDIAYVWNGSQIPHSAIRVLADSGLPIAFRLCEHWFAGLFEHDQFMRELLPSQRSLDRAAWSVACRALNAVPSMRLDPAAPLRAAISWASHALEQAVTVPPFVDAKLEQVRHPVPLHGDTYAAVVRDPAADPEIVFVGRVTPVKGVHIAIRALALLRRERGIEARLVVIGPEQRDYGRKLRRLVADLRLGAWVEWRGQLPADRIGAALSRAHAMIMPSDWDEPFGLVAVEAALASVPLVAADVGGVSEGMRDEEHALLFARGDAAGAAAALARTISDGAETRARVMRARARALEEFALEPYLDAQERFVANAYAVLRAG
ncbi:MAG: glycosyltransferase family 4 protein [Solirubrobacteraceae bacterium]